MAHEGVGWGWVGWLPDSASPRLSGHKRHAGDRLLPILDKSTDGALTLAAGAKPVILATAYFGSSGSLSRWIPAGGGIANVILGVLFVMASHLLRAPKPHIRYFFTLIIAFNLPFASAYPAYSGVTGFGDWAAVMAVEMRPVCGSDTPEALMRLQRITLISYAAALRPGIRFGLR